MQLSGVVWFSLHITSHNKWLTWGCPWRPQGRGMRPGQVDMDCLDCRDIAPPSEQRWYVPINSEKNGDHGIVWVDSRTRSCLSWSIKGVLFIRLYVYQKTLSWKWSLPKVLGFGSWAFHWREGTHNYYWSEFFSVPGIGLTRLHPGKLTWNIIMEVWKIIFLSKWVIYMFHVNLPGCMSKNLLEGKEPTFSGFFPAGWRDIAALFTFFLNWVVVSNILEFSPLFGEDYPVDSYFSDGLKPPTS